jgi:hypothetical protein
LALDAIRKKVEEDSECPEVEFIQVQQDWVDRLHEAIKLYNHSPKCATGFSPLEAHFPEQREPAENFVLDASHARVYDTYTQESADIIVQKVVAANNKSALNYLGKASKKKVVKLAFLKVGDKVLVRTEVEGSRRKKVLGKGYYPFSGKIAEVVRGGKRYKVKWGLAPGCGEQTETVSKKNFKREQLLAITDEFEELTVQHFKNADSWNSYHVSNATEVVKEVLRERRIGTEGYLEALCLLHKKSIPEWKPVTSVADTNAYMYFQQHKVSEIYLLFFKDSAFLTFVKSRTITRSYDNRIAQLNLRTTSTKSSEYLGKMDLRYLFCGEITTNLLGNLSKTYDTSKFTKGGNQIWKKRVKKKRVKKKRVKKKRVKRTRKIVKKKRVKRVRKKRVKTKIVLRTKVQKKKKKTVRKKRVKMNSVKAKVKRKA